MHIAVLGLNHKTAPVELRERLAFQEEKLPQALDSLRRELKIPECVILSTCNRVELYTLLPKLDGHHGRLKEFLARFHRVEPNALGERLYWYREPTSVRHLFRVASGLESMVVGESEILGQVREAYQKGVSCGSVGEVFHRLFQTALRAGKAVRSKTRIGQGAVSVSSVAVELARRIFQNLPMKTILTLGAGAMGEATLQSLKGQGSDRILVANRSPRGRGQAGGGRGRRSRTLAKSGGSGGPRRYRDLLDRFGPLALDPRPDSTLDVPPPAKAPVPDRHLGSPQPRPGHRRP